MRATMPTHPLALQGRNIHVGGPCPALTRPPVGDGAVVFLAVSNLREYKRRSPWSSIMEAGVCSVEPVQSVSVLLLR